MTLQTTQLADPTFTLVVVDECAQVSALQNRRWFVPKDIERAFKIFTYCLVGVDGFQAYLGL